LVLFLCKYYVYVMVSLLLSAAVLLLGMLWAQTSNGFL